MKLSSASIVVFLVAAIFVSCPSRLAPAAEPTAPVDDAKAPAGDQIAPLIAALRKVPPQPEFMLGSRYFDMHGNSCREIRALLRRRFGATQAICKEIDHLGPGGDREYAAVLYYCLGYVKDPASIPWLANKLKHGAPAEFYSGWQWSAPLCGVGRSQLKWLEKPDLWARFFRENAKKERDARRRLDWQKILAAWFHDPQTVQFFAELEQAPETEAETMLVAQLYLHQHKRPIDARKLRTAIDKFRSQPDGDKILLRYAEEFGHEAFIPWLITSPSNTRDPDYVIAPSVLEKITFRCDVRGRQAWQRWYEKNGLAGREAWLRQAAAEFEALAEKDPKKAVEFFDRAMYRWNDRALLPYAQRWVKYDFLHSHLIGWINLSYHPFWHEDLRPIAEKIIHENYDRLEEWARRIVRDLDFTRNDEKWEDQFDWYCA